MTIEIAREVLSTEVEGILAVRKAIGAEFEQAVDLIMAGGRLVITGIGKSGIIGQKIVATLNSTGTPSFFLHPVEAMHGDLGMVSGGDPVLAISYSGETGELNGLLASLRERRVRVIAMTGCPTSTLAGFAEVVLNIHVPREACPLGLAPTTSTTATLALGDALAVALLKRKQFQAEDFRRNHPGGSLGERLKVAVSEVMLTGERIPLVEAGLPLPEALAVLNRKNLGAVIIVNQDSEVSGILTDGDLRRLVSEDGIAPDATIGEVMTVRPKTITADLLAADALSIMQRHEITVLPVTGENGRLEGMLHLHDLLGKGEFRFLV